MVFLDLRPLPDAAELHERVARVALVLGLHDLSLVGRGDEPELHQLRVGQEVQRDQVSARLLQC